ncbi:hypothetical protein P4H66_12670 [Paenibacillus dokdonensis]|uniref:Uncharacterized protein n=1 Tax=Paenibacillus dokdonensis TaxID=2567944 RepID=A0ABU6GQY4_9BACL|nr:hypothetical protein [Paenibacillus dokdonensis]MEC0240701.1 hypothetical protein [Paenibacillus dokdonensis]
MSVASIAVVIGLFLKVIYGYNPMTKATALLLRNRSFSTLLGC